MNNECGCERGDDCTRTTVCQLNSAVEDATEALDGSLLGAAQHFLVALNDADRDVLTHALAQARAHRANFAMHPHHRNLWKKLATIFNTELKEYRP